MFVIVLVCDKELIDVSDEIDILEVEFLLVVFLLLEEGLLMVFSEFIVLLYSFV